MVPGPNLLESPGTGWLRMIGRVRPGVSVSGAHPELTENFPPGRDRNLRAERAGDDWRDIARAIIRLQPAAQGLSRLRTQFARPLQLLMGRSSWCC